MTAHSIPYEKRVLARDAPVAVAEGMCQCGCGGETSIARSSDRRYGQIAGRPRRFISGHSSRPIGPLWTVRDTRYATPCWIWTGRLNNAGYAMRTRAEHQTELVHRQNYVDKFGHVEVGLDLDHLCRVRACVNPDHMEPVSRAINARRGAKTKLTQAAVDEIRLSTESDEVLADRYGVAPGTIWHVRSGTQWRS